MSEAHQQALRTLDITCSMSRTGDGYDNAAMEEFFRSLKHGWTKHEQFGTTAAARMSVFKYIETFYNTERTHEALGYISPNQFEGERASARAA
jgi:putative transposase